MKKLKDLDFDLLKEAIKQVEDDVCIYVDYEELDVIQKMLVNGMLNKHANGLYTFFSFVQVAIERYGRLKDERDYYEKKSIGLEIKLKKYLGQRREPEEPEPVRYVKLKEEKK